MESQLGKDLLQTQSTGMKIPRCGSFLIVVMKTVLLALKSEAEFPVGEHVWEIQSENVCDGKGNGSVLSLMLSKCNETEYSCSDGSCIPILEKCNFVPNCWDGKDEESCPILSFRNVEGYKSDLPDIQIYDNGDIKEIPVIINITIQSIQTVSEVYMKFASSYGSKMDCLPSDLE